MSAASMVSSPCSERISSRPAASIPSKTPFAFASAILNCDPFAKAKSAIEPSGANTVKRLSSAPDVERFSKPLNETLKQLTWSNR